MIEQEIIENHLFALLYHLLSFKTKIAKETRILQLHLKYSKYRNDSFLVPWYISKLSVANHRAINIRYDLIFCIYKVAWYTTGFALLVFYLSLGC